MKDAKGHGSAAHGGGVDQVGRVPVQPGVWYHTYYKNDGEDAGSVSAVVPDKSFLRPK